MAHSAVIIDQFVVVFGGLNKEKNNLISNDLYILCLNGVTNALIPKEKQSIILDEKKEKMLLKKQKTLKASVKESSMNFQPPAAPSETTKPRAESIVTNGEE